MLETLLEIIPARSRAQGERVEQVGGLPWFVRDRARCLGSWLTGTGEDRSDRQALTCDWTLAFWGDARIFLNQRASVQSRLRIWRSLAFSIGDHYLASIRPSVTWDDGLSAHFNKFVHRMLALSRRDGESVASSCIRRNHETAHVKLLVRADTKFRHAYKLCAWVEHLYRQKNRPSFHLLKCQDDSW